MTTGDDLGNCASFVSSAPAMQYEEGMEGAIANINSHSAVLIGHRIFIIGGAFNSRLSVMVYICDTKSFTWSILPVNPGGLTLDEHMVGLAFVRKEEIYAAAYDLSRSRFAMYMLDCVLLNGWRIISDSDGFEAPDDYPPGAYHEQTDQAFIYAQRTLYVFAGSRRSCTVPKTKGIFPHDLRDHQCCTSPTTFFIVGNRGERLALYGLSIKDLAWARVQCCTAYEPPCRLLYTMSYIHGRIFVMGGYGAQNQLDVFSVSESKWYNVVSGDGLNCPDRILLNGLGLQGGTAQHAVVYTKDRMFFVGGLNRDYASLYFLLLRPG